MERIWAPWRMVYILAEADKKEGRGCIFCDLPAEGGSQQRENLILSCGQRCFLILNRYPYNNGHLLVVPRVHVPDPSLLDHGDYQLLSEVLRQATSALGEATQPHGINLGMNLGRTAGAGIDEHCHYHLVPRWDGDTNFMPVVGEVKVISEGLLETYDRLFPFLKDIVPDVERAMGAAREGGGEEGGG